MKPKHFSTLLSIAIISLVISSCGGQKKPLSSIIVTPKNISIKGDLGEYFEVVNKEYQIKPDEHSALKDEFKPGIISVEVKRNDKDFSFLANKVDFFGTSGYDVEYHVGFGIELFGDDGPEQILNANDYDSPLKKEDVLSLINLKKEETGFIRFIVDKSKSIKTFQLTSALEKTTAWKRDSPDNNSSTSSTIEENSSLDEETSSTDIESSSADCDKFIKDYEAFINSYIKLIKKYKANPTDATILSEYTEALEKASAMENNVSLCNDTKYAAKLLELQTKLAKAAF
jgi:hypothetical protein